MEKKMTKLQELEARIVALETRKKSAISFVRSGASQGEGSIYEVADENRGYVCGAERDFPLKTVVLALARKVGLKIIYHYPTGERIEFK